MVIRLGRNGRFLACSLYPEHKETRPLPGEEPAEVAVEGVGEQCPECGQGTLVARRGRFGPFAGCSRYPECGYIRRTGPPPPPPLPFEVECPKCGQGQLVARRARRSGTTFWGCSRYPKCDFTTSREPVGALHDADAGPVARNGDDGICLRCGARVELPAEVTPGQRLPGGEPNPEALLAPRRQARAKGGPTRVGAGPKGRRPKAESGPAGEAAPTTEAHPGGCRTGSRARRRPPAAAA